MAAISPNTYDKSTGAVAIATTVAPAKNFVLLAVYMELSAVGGAVEDFTITLDANEGAAYDAVIFAQDMSTATNLLYIPEQPIPFQNGDELDIAYANTNTRTYGLTVVYRGEF